MTSPNANRAEDWVSKMTDQNLLDALSACDRKPGPIVATTRALYQKMILSFLVTDEAQTLGRIEEYLSRNPGARQAWIASGLPQLDNDTSAAFGVSRKMYSNCDESRTTTNLASGVRRRVLEVCDDEGQRRQQLGSQDEGRLEAVQGKYSILRMFPLVLLLAVVGLGVLSLMSNSSDHDAALEGPNDELDMLLNSM